MHAFYWMSADTVVLLLKLLWLNYILLNHGMKNDVEGPTNIVISLPNNVILDQGATGPGVAWDPFEGARDGTQYYHV